MYQGYKTSGLFLMFPTFHDLYRCFLFVISLWINSHPVLLQAALKVSQSGSFVERSCNQLWDLSRFQSCPHHSSCQRTQLSSQSQTRVELNVITVHYGRDTLTTAFCRCLLTSLVPPCPAYPLQHQMNGNCDTSSVTNRKAVRFFVWFCLYAEPEKQCPSFKKH